METTSERRARILRQKEHMHLRKVHGERIVSSLAHGLQVPLSLSDFHVDVVPPWNVFWSGRVDDTPGAVAAYVDKASALKLLHCIGEKNLPGSGSLGIYENEYLGICSLPRIGVVDLLAAAELTRETLVFYPDNVRGAIVVDCYVSNAGEPYSVIVQGDDLVSQLRHCFRSE